jgi:uncharacterized hydrophobic protein (TIGR00341 family)
MANGDQTESFLNYQLSSDERREVLEELFVFGKDKYRPFLNRMAVLLIVSTIIASCGLLANSAAVVIGAMLVAPLMRPVMSAAAAITLGWKPRLYQALLLVSAMAVGAVLIAIVLTFLAPHMIDIPEQVLARTEPTFFDLVIALAAGAGGAYVMTRKESSTIPGVAMAVALLPPLASCGILIVFKQYDLSLKAFVLFFTNFAAMVLAGALTFIVVGISPQKNREKSARSIRNHLVLFALMVVSISIPLYFYSEDAWYDASYKANQSEELQQWLKENRLIINTVKIDLEDRIIHMHLFGPNPPLNIETLHTELTKSQKIKTGKTEPFRIEVGWTQKNHFSWPPSVGDNHKEALKRDFLKLLINYKWYWTGTQYADGKWSKPEVSGIYSIKVRKDKTIKVTTTCKPEVGEYSVQQEIITIEFDTELDEGTCKQLKIDKRFFSDLNDIISLSLDDDRLSLRLDNDNGVMHFEYDENELIIY